MFAGKWVNGNGSAMILDQQGDRISGRYLTRIGHEDVAGKDHSIVGVANGPTVGFVVGWPAAGSVTTWAGRLQMDAGGAARLHTLWHLVRSVTGDPSRALDTWENFLANSAVCTKVADTT